MGIKPQLAHLGIIMDGNRRWAKKRGLPQLEGHRRGYDKVKKVTEWCIDADIKVLTVYAFSTENWNRSKAEVEYLMNLFRRALSKDIDNFHRQAVKVRIIGQVWRFAPDIQKMIQAAERKTKGNKKLLLHIAISYGGRPEIVEAVQKIIRKKIPAAKVNEALVSSYLWTAGAPDPDLIIRTANEHRLSNFLTWQSAYSELLFIEKAWPEFSRADFDAAVADFEQRQRRFGR